MDLSNWVFERFGREHYCPGLDRMRFALGKSLIQLNKFKIITIAGTNGKGETTLRLARSIKNKKFAVWTSPHVESLTERFRNQDGLIEENELYLLLEKTYLEVKTHHYEVSFYEFLFLVFCRWVENQNLDYLLLEVGLGGEFDAVNVLDADIVLLPSISRDHQDFLGNRYDGILKEKLGVLRAKTTLISFLDLHYLNERIKHKINTVGAKWINLGGRCSQLGFSQRNQLLAYVALNLLEDRLDASNPLIGFVPHDDFVENRGEIIRHGADFSIFGSHNTDGMRKLIQFLHSGIYTSSKLNFDMTIVSFSSRSVDDLRTMLKMLKSGKVLGRVVITSFSHPKAFDALLLKDLSLQEGLEFVEDISSEISSLSSGQVLVAGSYYFLSYFKSLLGK